jgi:hypothetical protein
MRAGVSQGFQYPDHSVLHQRAAQKEQRGMSEDPQEKLGQGFVPVESGFMAVHRFILRSGEHNTRHMADAAVNFEQGRLMVIGHQVVEFVRLIALCYGKRFRGGLFQQPVEIGGDLQVWKSPVQPREFFLYSGIRLEIEKLFFYCGSVYPRIPSAGLPWLNQFFCLFRFFNSVFVHKQRLC